MKHFFAACKSFHLALTTIILVAAGLPAILLSFPLINKIYHGTSEAAVKELELRADNISIELTHQLDIIASRLLFLSNTSDIVIGSDNMLFRNLVTDKYLIQFEKSMPLVSSVYLVNVSSSIVAAAPISVEVVELPDSIKHILKHLFQYDAETIQSQYQFVEFNDKSFFGKIADKQKRNGKVSYRTSYGLAVIAPLVNDGKMIGGKIVTGALVAIIPFENLISYTSSKLQSPKLFEFKKEEGASIFKTAYKMPPNDQLISSDSSLYIESSNQDIQPPIKYQLVLSEPELERFAKVNNELYRIGTFVSIFLAFILILAYFLSRRLLYPLQDMKIIVNKYASGDYSPSGKEMFFLEFASVIDLLEGMGRKILNQIDELREINQAYARFVPNDFLNHLERESIIAVQLGDHVEKNMSVLFSDIADFTKLSEQMNPKENFTFVNTILQNIGPIIRNHNGFIDKYIGDAIMALFDRSPNDAVDAGIALLHTLAKYNDERKKEGYEPVKIRIGINTGHLMLGIIGEYGRMEGTVISDAVNLASRFEGLTKIYGSSMLITEHTCQHLKNVSSYKIRELDIVAVKGKSKPVIVFEVIDGDPPEIQEKKFQTKKQFEKAVLLYRRKEFQQTIQLMQGILQMNPDDKAAQLYINRSKTNLEAGVPEDWNGVAHLCQK